MSGTASHEAPTAGGQNRLAHHALKWRAKIERGVNEMLGHTQDPSFVLKAKYVFATDATFDEACIRKFRTDNSPVVPYADLSFLKGAIKEIIIGPGPHRTEVHHAVKMFSKSLALETLVNAFQAFHFAIGSQADSAGWSRAGSKAAAIGQVARETTWLVPHCQTDRSNPGVEVSIHGSDRLVSRVVQNPSADPKFVPITLKLLDPSLHTDGATAEIGIEIAGVLAAIGHGGAFDFQRVGNSFFKNRSDASNFGVGVYMAGFGIH